MPRRTHNQRRHSRTTLLLVGVMVYLLGLSDVHAQGVDTTRILQVVAAQSELDSLRTLIRKIETDLESLKLSYAEGTDLQKLLSALVEEEADDIPEDQRSKRKRVDALLKAISDRPGQLRFNGGATSILHWNPDGARGFATATGSFDIFAHTSLGKGTLFFVDIEAIGGNGPDARIANRSVLNADAGSTQDADGIDRLTVLEAWAEATLLDEAVTVTAGKIDITNYVDNNAVANDETSQFLTGAFVNSVALPQFSNAPGIRLRTSIVEKFFVQAAIVGTENRGDALFARLLKIASVGMKLFPESENEGNIRFYAYLLPSPGNDGGFGVSYDQSIVRAVTIFGRFGQNQKGAAGMWGLRNAWSGGIRYATTLFGTRFVAGAAFGQSTTPTPGSLRERVGELYGRFQVNRWSFISPHMQWIRPGGSGTDHLLLSVRTQLNF